MKHLVSFFLLAFGLLGIGQAPGPLTMAFDHVHLAVPDPQQAYEWYVRHLHGHVAEFPGRVAFTPWTSRRPLPIQLLFTRSAGAAPSIGSSLECLGFSVADLDGTVAAMQRAGGRVVEPVSSRAGSWRRAVVDDPWGVRLELVQDAGLPGLRHVVVRSPDVAATIAWYRRVFGGRHLILDGRFDAVEFGTVYLAVVEGHSLPSRGHAIDHISWGPTDIVSTVADLLRQGVKVTTAISGPNAFGHHTAFVEDPDGISIELVQHDELLAAP